MLGNMQAESSLNPGRWQNDTINSSSLGYGLVQWTPSTKYTEWCSSQGLTDPSEMDSNIQRIVYEVDNNLQWIPRDPYNFSFEEFAHSNESASNLAKAFLLCYERPADQSEDVQNYRSSLAVTWYKFLTGLNPGQPVDRKRRGYNFLNTKC